MGWSELFVRFGFISIADCSDIGLCAAIASRAHLTDFAKDSKSTVTRSTFIAFKKYLPSFLEPRPLIVANKQLKRDRIVAGDIFNGGGCLFSISFPDAFVKIYHEIDDKLRELHRRHGVINAAIF